MLVEVGRQNMKDILNLRATLVLYESWKSQPLDKIFTNSPVDTLISFSP